MPSSVELDRRQRAQVRRLAKRLARPEPIDAAVYSGPILEIGHGEAGEKGYFVLLDTYYRDRKSRLRVSLTEDQHERAIPWYRDRATLIVHGDATHARSELVMTEPRRIEAWGDIQL